MRAIIIDDERHCISTLKILLAEVDGVEVIASFDNSIEALKYISEKSFDLLFLDIEMPHLNGFELLALCPDHKWKVIFTTAYDEFAVQAFKVNAIDYLLKPIDRADLAIAIEKVQNLINHDNVNIQQVIEKEFNSRLNKIAIPTMAGLELILVDDILYVESQSNYSRIKMKNASHTISKTLKSFTQMTKGYGFVRVHNSYIVNPNKIIRYVKGDGGYVIMEDGTNISVSRSRKSDLISALNIV